MKQTILLLLAIVFCFACVGCQEIAVPADIAATTLPVYELTLRLCDGTDLTVEQIITENVSCLHDYTLQPAQMKSLETAKLTVLSGAGLEDFMADSLPETAVDASAGIAMHCADHHHDHEHEEEHEDEYDPHIWLSPENGKKMAENIYAALCDCFPDKKEAFSANWEALSRDFDALIAYGKQELCDISCTELITFHDGFSYMAECYGLSILHSMEEESGSEASAKDLIAVCRMVSAHNIPAVFTEKNGSDRAASIVATETGAMVYTLDTGMADGYFNAMYHNIDTLKEALG